MLAVSPQPASVWTEIGEARITHNIFGKAKVRIIRKNDNLYRAMRWAIAVAIAVVAWQVWVALQPAEQSADSLPHVIPDLQESTPAASENIEPTSAPVSMNSTAERSEPVKPPVIEKKTPLPETSVKAVEPIHKPVVPRPEIASKPQAMSLAASGAAVTQTIRPQPLKPQPPRRAVAPAVVSPPAMKSAASSPEAIMQLSSPVTEEETQPQPPAQQKPPEK